MKTDLHIIKCKFLISKVCVCVWGALPSPEESDGVIAAYLGVPLYRPFFPCLYHLFRFGLCSELHYSGELYECLSSLKRVWCLQRDPCLCRLVALNVEEPDFLAEALCFFELVRLKQKNKDINGIIMECKGNQVFHQNQNGYAGVTVQRSLMDQV